MVEDKRILLDKKQLNEIEDEIVKKIEKYIDEKMEPLLNYFQKKKDYYEMSFL